jgi:hypothetical protein
MLAHGLACAQEASLDEFPGMELRARLEAQLQGRQAELREEPAHYGLVFEVEQDDLQGFMKRIWIHQDGAGFVLGSRYGVEGHGAGVLALLLEHWRPASRRARLPDEFWFEANRRSLQLEEIYRGHQSQIFLPVPGKDPGEIDSELPTSPQLPRMRFRYWTQPAPADTDSYEFLGLLITHEEQLGATWSNQLHQELSVDLLLRNTRDYYLTSGGTAGELADHTHLHLVEVLLAYDRRSGQPDGADAIKRRFLEVELSRRSFGGDDGNEALGHYVESLGLLVADPNVTWQPSEKQQVRDWLRKLEQDRFHDLEVVRLAHLTHLLKGLRQIEENRARLE